MFRLLHCVLLKVFALVQRTRINSWQITCGFCIFIGRIGKGFEITDINIIDS